MLALIAALFCVVANGFFVAAEFALVKVRPSSLEARAKAGDARASRALSALANLEENLSVAQLGITLASLALGWLGEPAIAVVVEPKLTELGLPAGVGHAIAITLAFSIITGLHIVVGEQAPKYLAIQRSERVVLASARLMQLFYFATFPLVRALNGFSNAFLRFVGLGSAPPHDHGAVSPEEIRVIVQASFRAGSLEGAQRDLLERVLRGSGRTVRAVMVPRVDMAVISLDDDFEACTRRMRREGYSRYPLTEGNNPDHIVGYLYSKDLWLRATPPKEGLAALRRDILFVPETRTVAEVIEDFRKSTSPIAIVVDEYGGTRGLVTLEDCVEEIVGDIRDETDEESTSLSIRPDGSVIVDGTIAFGDLEIEELRDLAGPEGLDTTVSAFIMERLGRIPHPGDRLRVGAFEAVVETVRRRRIARVLFRALPDRLSHSPAT